MSLPRLLPVAALSLLLGACATTSDIEQTRRELDAARAQHAEFSPGVGDEPAEVGEAVMLAAAIVWLIVGLLAHGMSLRKWDYRVRRAVTIL